MSGTGTLHENFSYKRNDNRFNIILIVSITVFISSGLYFNTFKHRPADNSAGQKRVMVKTQFMIEEKKKEKKRPETVKKSKPVDLTDKPKLNQKTDDIKEPEEKQKKKVRRVYGVKKVYSRGLGSGGSMEDAVIGKRGNTLNKDFDTLTATEEEIKGEPVSVTTVTSPPEILKKSKPVYTEAMLKNEVEGTIKVKVLVDIDGRVKKAVALSDLGYGSEAQATKACFEMVFSPAMRGDEPVAVWIIVPVRFVYLG